MRKDNMPGNDVILSNEGVKLESRARGMKKLLWAVKTPYNALCKAIGKRV